MNATRKVKLKDINVNLTCKLCLGYLIDATTIIECLHSFCKTCIINYLEKSERDEKYCPVCDVQLHQTKPLTSIRSDLMLQEIVYKLVPGLFKSEMKRRRKFYDGSDSPTPANQIDSGQVFEQLYTTSDDLMHLSLEYVTDDEKLKENTKRYLKCPAAVPVLVLKKLLIAKHDLTISQSDIDVMFGDRILPDDFLLMDVAYKYSCSMNWNKPLTLRYRIRGPKDAAREPEKVEPDPVTPCKLENISKEEPPPTPPPANKKRVCNENGSNIMPSDKVIPNHIKIPPNGFISGDVSISPIKTPNGKLKRKRKQLGSSQTVLENKDIKQLKRLKVDKGSVTPTVNKSTLESSFHAETQVEALSLMVAERDLSNKNESSSCEKKEVAENGVSSGRVISSSTIDKIANDLSKRAVKFAGVPQMSNNNTSLTINIDKTEKLLLSSACHSKKGPSGVTEIICEKPDPGSTSRKGSTAKPGYIQLDIPTPKSLPPGSTNTLARPLEKPTRAEIMDMIKSMVDSKTSAALTSAPTAQNGESNGCGDHKANSLHVQPSTTSSQNLRLPRPKTWIPPTNGSDTLPEFSSKSGMSISVIPQLNTNGKVHSLPTNGTNSITLQLNSQSSIAVHKKYNRSLKPILPKTSKGPSDQLQDNPRKFFKQRKQVSPSRVASTKASESSNSGGPEGKKKIKMDNGLDQGGKKDPDMTKHSDSLMQFLPLRYDDKRMPPKSNLSGLHLPTNGPSPLNSAYATLLEQYAYPPITSNTVADVNPTNAISRPSMSTVPNGNGMGVGGIPPFGTYGFLNSKFNQMSVFPFGYNLFPQASIGIDNTKLTTAITTPVNSIKSKETNSHLSEKTARNANGLPSSLNSSSNPKDEAAVSTLDLSVPKSPPNESRESPKANKAETNPLLTNLLENPEKSPQSQAIPKKSNSPIVNGANPDVSEQVDKPKSPIIRQLLENSQGMNGSRSPSPNKPQPQNGTSPAASGKNIEKNSEKLATNGSGTHVLTVSETENDKVKAGDQDKMQTSRCKLAEGEASSESAPISPKANNNNCSSNGNIKNRNPFSFDPETLLRLSAQNNNINKLSNNHDAIKRNSRPGEPESAKISMDKKDGSALSTPDTRELTS